ncbi:MAG: hypothetical protein NTU44_13625 [Bacteroidetes bacterium]|nr:hypothetical protein [Bacteroidota bacterium]
MDILVDLSKYNHLLGLDCDEMVAKASGRSVDENMKMLSDIRFYLILTNRWVNLIACAVGYFGVAVIYVVLFGLTAKVVVFMNISMVAFPLYYYMVFDRSYRRTRNLEVRLAVVQYKQVLRGVIAQQQVSAVLLKHYHPDKEH